MTLRMPLLVLVPEPVLEEAPAQDDGVRDGVVLEEEAQVLVYDDVPWLLALEPVCDSLLQLVLEPVHV